MGLNVGIKIRCRGLSSFAVVSADGIGKQKVGGQHTSSTEWPIHQVWWSSSVGILSNAIANKKVFGLRSIDIGKLLMGLLSNFGSHAVLLVGNLGTRHIVFSTFPHRIRGVGIKTKWGGFTGPHERFGVAATTPKPECGMDWASRPSIVAFTSPDA